MKNMRILFDSNIILDYIVDREPFSSDAETVINLCMEKGFDCSVAAHTITNVFYILRKDMSLEDRRNVLLRILGMFNVVGIDADKLASALSNKDFADFEDCLQHECALAFSADYILTRNKKDFSDSSIPAIDPQELATMVQS